MNHIYYGMNDRQLHAGIFGAHTHMHTYQAVIYMLWDSVLSLIIPSTQN